MENISKNPNLSKITELHQTHSQLALLIIIALTCVTQGADMCCASGVIFPNFISGKGWARFLPLQTPGRSACARSQFWAPESRLREGLQARECPLWTALPVSPRGGGAFSEPPLWVEFYETIVPEILAPEVRGLKSVIFIWIRHHTFSICPKKNYFGKRRRLGVFP